MEPSFGVERTSRPSTCQSNIMTRIGLTLNRLGRRSAVKGCDGCKVTFRDGALLLVLLATLGVLTQSAVAQTRGGAVTLRYASFSPIIALLAGILILIMPRLLNYIVAIYLILVGLIGLFGV